jgi:hypothetical protein
MGEISERLAVPLKAKAGGLGVWQAKLLPLMVGMLVVLTAFFCVSNIVQMYVINSHIERSDELNLEPALSVLQADAKTDPLMRLEYARLKTQALLEGSALKNRYHQASVIMMSRVYIVYLGFITGMVLAMVGAAFILGKLRESETQMSAESQAVKVSLTSASPGLLLAVMGTILMLSTIWARSEVKVTDTPLYMPVADEQGLAPADAPPPSLDKLGKDVSGKLDRIEGRQSGGGEGGGERRQISRRRKRK